MAPAPRFGRAEARTAAPRIISGGVHGGMLGQAAHQMSDRVPTALEAGNIDEPAKFGARATAKPANAGPA